MKQFPIHIIYIAAIVMMLLSCSDQNNKSNAAEKESDLLASMISLVEPPQNLKPIEYLNYCEDGVSGLKKSKTIGDFSFSAYYQPVNYLALKELKNNDSLTEKLFNEKKTEYGSMTYFSFKIENTKQTAELLKLNLSSESQYYARLEYMAFKMQDDFKLIQGKDTLDCVLYHFERVYGLAPKATFVLGFPEIKRDADLKIWYHDKIFNSGIVMINYPKEIINNIPQLDI